MGRSIPDRWRPYKACGNLIDGTRIVCFKVPLKRSVQSNIEERDIWDIDALTAAIPNLGGVIDLTNTSRYYNPEDIQQKGVVYKKISLPGREIPPNQKVTEFVSAVDDILKNNEGSVVGVHCTHGLNRTGYMVCRYMRDRLGIPAHDAIKRFEVARGYHIERNNYIADLLGEVPPPPDLSKNTQLKPVTDKNHLQSPSDNAKKRKSDIR